MKGGWRYRKGGRRRGKELEGRRRDGKREGQRKGRGEGGTKKIGRRFIVWGRGRLFGLNACTCHS